MANFFAYYPKTYYSANSADPNLQLVTNITTRFAFEDSLKSNFAAFYEYEIKDGDTPEIIASKYYGNPERHWMVLLFNNIIDPQFDWPLDYRSYVNFLNSKYSGIANVTIQTAGTGYSNGYVTFQTVDGVGEGANAYYTVHANGAIANVQIISIGSGYLQAPNVSVTGGNNNAVLTSTLIADPIAWAKLNTHSYYKVKTSTTSTKTTIEKFQVDSNTYANDVIMQTGSNETYQLADGSSVNVIITKETKSYFDYENEVNENKRKIKLIRADFASDIEKEFKSKVRQ